MSNVLRRRFLQLAIGATAIIMGQPAVSLFSSPANKKNLVIDWRLTLINNLTSAKAVGAAYLEQHHDEMIRKTLIRRLFAGSDEFLIAVSSGDEGAVRRCFLDKHRSDLDSNNVFKINGWLLSKTEARICALMAL